jgi:hypothetical protein
VGGTASQQDNSQGHGQKKPHGHGTLTQQCGWQAAMLTTAMTAQIVGNFILFSPYWEFPYVCKGCLTMI